MSASAIPATNTLSVAQLAAAIKLVEMSGGPVPPERSLDEVLDEFLRAYDVLEGIRAHGVQEGRGRLENK